MNGNNTHHTGWHPITPARDSAGWKRVIARGCGGDSYNTSDGPEFYCRHEYTWVCEECPVGIEQMETLEAKWEYEHQGPPRPNLKGIGFEATVGAELRFYEVGFNQGEDA